MRDSPAVSVLMPVFNGQRFLAETIDSILAQTVTDFEFLILDDGSTDGSLDLLRTYENRDPRIVVIARENRGVLKSLNDLLARLTGDFNARIDADDIVLPNPFDVQL